MNKTSKFMWIAAFILPAVASADYSTPTVNVTRIDDVFALVWKIFGYLFYVLILAAIYFVIMAAFKYLTSSGDPEKVKEASQQLMFAAVAVVVGILAKVLPPIVASIIGVQFNF